jgi:hypothetical protein
MTITSSNLNRGIGVPLGKATIKGNKIIKTNGNHDFFIKNIP